VMAMKLRRVAALLATAWAAPDALSDLKAENPNAYSIVKGLLAKQKLGVLNPMHPSAPLDSQLEASSDGDIALDEYKPTGHDSMAMAADTAAAKLGGTWLGWKPKQEDDSEVSNLLNTVEELTGKVVPPAKSTKSTKHLRHAEPSTQVSSAFDWLQAPTLPAENAAPERTVHTGRRNTYLADLGLDSLAAKTAEARAQLDGDSSISELDQRMNLAESEPVESTKENRPPADDEEAMLTSALGLETQTPVRARASPISHSRAAPEESKEEPVERRHEFKKHSHQKQEHKIKTVNPYANPYLKALGLTRAKVEEEEKTRTPTDSTNPYLQGMDDLHVRKSVSLSALKTYEDNAESKTMDTPARHPDRHPDQLNKWLES